MAMQVGDHGVDAVILALIHFIHPSQHMRDKFPNLVAAQHLNCVTLWQEVKMFSRKEQLCLIVQHDDFKNDNDTEIQLYSVKMF